MFQVRKLRSNQVTWSFDPGSPLGWIEVGEISRVGQGGQACGQAGWRERETLEEEAGEEAVDI